MMISIIKLNNYIENNLPRRIFKKILTVYRGQSVSKEEFDNIQKTLGGFILFNNFNILIIYIILNLCISFK